MRDESGDMRDESGDMTDDSGNTRGESGDMRDDSGDIRDDSGDIRDDSAEIIFQCFLQEACISNSGMGGDVHSLMLFIQHFLCRPRRRPPSRVRC